MKYENELRKRFGITYKECDCCDLCHEDMNMGYDDMDITINGEEYICCCNLKNFIEAMSLEELKRRDTKMKCLIIYRTSDNETKIYLSNDSRFLSCHNYYVNTPDLKSEIKALILRIKDECEEIDTMFDVNETIRLIITGD